MVNLVFNSEGLCKTSYRLKDTNQPPSEVTEPQM